jgi:hypothetical protein
MDEATAQNTIATSLPLRSAVPTTDRVGQKRKCDHMSKENSEQATNFLKIAPIEASVADSRTIFNEVCALDDPRKRKAELLHKYVIYKKAGILMDQAQRAEEAVSYNQKATEAFLNLDVLAAEQLGAEGKSKVVDALQRLAMFQLSRSLAIEGKPAPKLANGAARPPRSSKRSRARNSPTTTKRPGSPSKAAAPVR